MNTNDLPLAQKLAALMEAGRAAHPNVSHVRGVWGDGKEQGCAMTFAGLGAGLEGLRSRPLVDKLAEMLGASADEMDAIVRRVVHMNDCHNATLPEIIAAIREDRLPEPPVLSLYTPNGIATAVQKMQAAMLEQLFEEQKILLLKPFPYIYVTGTSDPKTFSVKVEQVGASVPPDKSVRVSAKTGASWPKPKHAFA